MERKECERDGKDRKGGEERVKDKREGKSKHKDGMRMGREGT